MRPSPVRPCRSRRYAVRLPGRRARRCPRPRASRRARSPRCRVGAHPPRRRAPRRAAPRARSRSPWAPPRATPRSWRSPHATARRSASLQRATSSRAEAGCAPRSRAPPDRARSLGEDRQDRGIGRDGAARAGQIATPAREGGMVGDRARDGEHRRRRPRGASPLPGPAARRTRAPDARSSRGARDQALRKVVVVQLEGRGRPRIDLQRRHRSPSSRKSSPASPRRPVTRTSRSRDDCACARKARGRLDARDRTRIAIARIAERLDPEPVEPQAVGAIAVGEKSHRQRLTGDLALEVHRAAAVPPPARHGGRAMPPAPPVCFCSQPCRSAGGSRCVTGTRHPLARRSAMPSSGSFSAATIAGSFAYTLAVAREPGSELRRALESAPDDDCNVRIRAAPRRAPRSSRPGSIATPSSAADAHDFGDRPRVAVAERVEHDDAAPASLPRTARAHGRRSRRRRAWVSSVAGGLSGPPA